MLVANIVIDTLPGKARSVADLIGSLKGMNTLHVEGDRQVIVNWQAPDGQNPEPEGLSEVLRAMTEEIVQVALIDEEERA